MTKAQLLAVGCNDVLCGKLEKMSMENHDTSDTLKPACPSCGYLLSDDDMNDCGEDLWALAPNEDLACVTCPNCDTEYWVRGGYIPTYTSALAEEDL